MMDKNSSIAEGPSPGSHEYTVALAGTFTIESLAPSLNYLFERLAVDVELAFAPYNQVFQELLTPHSLLSSVGKGVDVVLLRLEDFVKDEPDVAQAQAQVGAVIQELIDAASTFAGRSKVATVHVVFRPAGTSSGALYRTLDEAVSRLADGLRAIPATTVIDSLAIDRLCEGERFDPIGDELGHVPYTEEYLAAIALAVARAVHSLLVTPQKVLVLDCDNTLWQGVVGEDGPSGISIPESYAAVHRFAVKVQGQGGLVCLASKNAERDVLEAFERRPEMPLKLNQVVAHRINWDPKSSNVASLARELNLGLDSFVFLDDNPVECGQMRAELPQVVTLQLPPPEKIDAFLANLWLFDRAALTDEDARRTTMYRENAARQQLEASTGDIVQFMDSLQMVVEIRPPVDGEWSRISQLTQKTNQFNFTTLRRTEQDLHALVDQGCTLLAVHVRDRFGDYGLVGFVLYAISADSIDVDSFILSCRVLGRGVEHSVMRRLGEDAAAENRASVVLTLTTTAKNEPASAFIDSVAGEYRQATPSGAVLTIPTSSVRAIQHRPGHDPEAIVKASRSETKAAVPGGASSTTPRSERYETFALELSSGAAVCRAVKSQGRRQRLLPGSPVPPANPVESGLIEIWQELFAIDGLGVEDDYSALGGTSLMAVRIFAAIFSTFETRLPLTTILTAPTIRQLAREIDNTANHGRDSIVPLRTGGASSLYLVHEGNGEILLYANVARRLPKHVSVFGVRPAVLPDVPLAHDSVEAMAAHYVDALLRQERAGPIYLGGLCAGGVIAFEMARQLQSKGRLVDRVFLLDAASPQALLRAGSPRRQRLNRLRSMCEDQWQRRGVIVGTLAAISTTLHKVARAFSRRWRAPSSLQAGPSRFDILHGVLHDGMAWPSSVEPLSALDIYGWSEGRHAPKKLVGVPVSLVHASAGEGNDRPLNTLYSEQALGWQSSAETLEIGQVRGGHASMFQEENVVSLAQFLEERMGHPPEGKRSNLSKALSSV